MQNAVALWRQLDDDEHRTVEIGSQLVEILRDVWGERPLVTVETRLTELTRRQPTG